MFTTNIRTAKNNKIKYSEKKFKIIPIKKTWSLINSTQLRF